MFLNILLFLLGFILLIKGGDWFVDSSCEIAKRFKIPEIIIGATIVSIGTTLPEIMVSATSALTGHSEMAYGNALGSIICNTALICAITLSVKPGKINKSSLVLPLIFFLVASLFYCFNVYYFQSFSRISGIILLSLFIIYMLLQIFLLKKQKGNSDLESNEDSLEEMREKELEMIDYLSENQKVSKDEFKTIFKFSILKFYKLAFIIISFKRKGIVEENDGFYLFTKTKEESIELINNPTKKENTLEFIKELFFLVLGVVAIALGAKLLVDNGSEIARAFGISEAVISITMVALGTSLPELVTAISALIKGHANLSIGNIIGANLLNLLVVSGLAITLKPFSIPDVSFINGINSSFIVDIPVMLGVMCILSIPPLSKGKVYRWQGILLLLIYIAFIIIQFVVL